MRAPVHAAPIAHAAPVAVAGPAFSTSYQTVIASHGVPAPILAAPAIPVAQYAPAPLHAPIATPLHGRFAWPA